MTYPHQSPVSSVSWPRASSVHTPSGATPSAHTTSGHGAPDQEALKAAARRSVKGTIPFPAHIHYELLLQLLEQQTASGLMQQAASRAQKEELRSLIRTLRKAFSQQKNLEESCQRSHLGVDYHWSLNTAVYDQSAPTAASSTTAQSPR